jgi:hypothetical protein
MTWNKDAPPPQGHHGYARHKPYGWCGGWTETVTTTTTTTGGCCEKKVVKIYEKPTKVRRRVKAKQVAIVEK